MKLDAQQKLVIAVTFHTARTILTSIRKQGLEKTIEDLHLVITTLSDTWDESVWKSMLHCCYTKQHEGGETDGID